MKHPIEVLDYKDTSSFTIDLIKLELTVGPMRMVASSISSMVVALPTMCCWRGYHVLLVSPGSVDTSLFHPPTISVLGLLEGAEDQICATISPFSIKRSPSL